VLHVGVGDGGDGGAHQRAAFEHFHRDRHYNLTRGGTERRSGLRRAWKAAGGKELSTHLNGDLTSRWE
jgi:hypothetical protein